MTLARRGLCVSSNGSLRVVMVNLRDCSRYRPIASIPARGGRSQRDGPTDSAVPAGGPQRRPQLGLGSVTCGRDLTSPAGVWRTTVGALLSRKSARRIAGRPRVPELEVAPGSRPEAQSVGG